ncbi:hypothetical protein [Govanella unica]|uniref:Uncharacterized protein n=1 Tax=Govanella unica TaxID=2975056 RepID=A0A9X3Z8B9_9PROT|nr:hypothetical protein [Govania unica]MDA5194943.1 hypothetical protein [Govania unica]
MINARTRNQGAKPDGAQDVDWSHPLAADLVVAVCPGEGAGPLRDLVSGNRSIAGTTSSWSALKSGRAVSFGSKQYNVIATRPLDALAAGYTVLWGGRFKAAGDSWDNWGGLFTFPAETTASNFIGIQRAATLDILQLFHNSSAGLSLNTTINAYVNTDLVIAASWDGTSLREFRNGALVQTANPSFVPTGRPDNRLHINSERALGGGAAQTLSFLYLFKRRLPDDVIADLTQRPFQILKPHRQMVIPRRSAGTAVSVVPDKAMQAHRASSPLVGQSHAVLPQSARQGQKAGVGTVVSVGSVVIGSCRQGHRAGSVLLSQQAQIIPARAVQGQRSGAGSVVTAGAVIIGSCRQAHTAGGVLLSQQALILPARAVQGQRAMIVLIRLDGVKTPLRRTEQIARDGRNVAAGHKIPVLKPRKQ